MYFRISKILFCSFWWWNTKQILAFLSDFQGGQFALCVQAPGRRDSRFPRFFSCIFFFNFDRESCCGDVPTKLSVFSGHLAGFQMLGGMKMEVAIKAVEGLPSGKHTKSYGKSPSWIGKSTINESFSVAVLNYQRVMINHCVCVFFDGFHELEDPSNIWFLMDCDMMD